MSTVPYTNSIYDTIRFVNENVGIGTDAPATKLHIVGDVHVYNENQKPVLKTSKDGIEMSGQARGFGSESATLGSNASYVLNENVPASHIFLDAPSNGSNLWVVAVDGDDANQYEVVSDVAVGKNGNVYTTMEIGNFLSIRQSATINAPDGSVFHVPELTEGNNVNRIAVVSCITPTGTPLWNRIVGVSNVYALAVDFNIRPDDFGNAYVSGNARNNVITFFDSNMAPFSTSPSDVFGSGFLAKYNQNGDPVWVSYITSGYNAIVLSHVVDTARNAVYVVGECSTGAPLLIYNADGNITSNAITNNGGEHTGFLVKYTLDGISQWVNFVNGVSTITHVNIDHDHNLVFGTGDEPGDGSTSIIIQSQDNNNITVSGQDVGIVVGKYNPDGNAVWGAKISSSWDIPINVLNVITDQYANVYAVVTSGVDTQITNPDGSIVNIPDFGSNMYMYREYSLYKFDASGTYQWNAQWYSSYVLDKPQTGLVVDSTGNIYVNHFGETDNPKLTVKSANGSCNVITLPFDNNNASSDSSIIFKFDSQGNFVTNIAYITSGNDGGVTSMTLDEERHRLYACGWMYFSSSFQMFNKQWQQVYIHNNIANQVGFLAGLNMDTGDVGSAGITLKLPAQETTNFRKDIYLTPMQTTPYTTYLELENRDHSFKYMPVTLDHSNVTVQKSLRWTSNSWVLASQFEPTINGVNLVSYYYGDQDYSISGSNFIGANIAWENRMTDNKRSFRVTTKCSIASDEEIAYRQFEAIVSPVDNQRGNLPCGIVSAEVGGTNGLHFSDLQHTITRSSDRSVDLKVSWNTNSSNYVGNIELHVLAATTRLGDVTFQPIHG